MRDWKSLDTLSWSKIIPQPLVANAVVKTRMGICQRTEVLPVNIGRDWSLDWLTTFL